MMAEATLYGLGLGPGDPDLMTVKAARLLSELRTIAYFAAPGRKGVARGMVEGLLHPNCTELRLEYPVTTELPAESDAYAAAMEGFYREITERLAEVLAGGTDVGLLCEGDPLLYGSFMHPYRRLKRRFNVEIVAGVAGMSGCWTSAGLPMTWGDDALLVLPATLPEEELRQRLAAAEALVFMKVGRHLQKVRSLLSEAGRLEEAVYVERGTMPGEKILPLAETRDLTAPYFSIVLVPGRGRGA